MSLPKSNRNNGAPIHLNDSAIDMLILNQSKQIELEGEKLKLLNVQEERRKEQTRLNAGFAEKALEAERVDRAHSRINDRTRELYRIGALLFVISIAGGLTYHCLSLGKEQVLIEIAKITIPALVTGFGGYSYGRFVNLQGKGEEQPKGGFNTSEVVDG